MLIVTAAVLALLNGCVGDKPEARPAQPVCWAVDAGRHEGHPHEVLTLREPGIARACRLIMHPWLAARGVPRAPATARRSASAGLSPSAHRRPHHVGQARWWRT